MGVLSYPRMLHDMERMMNSPLARCFACARLPRLNGKNPMHVQIGPPVHPPRSAPAAWERADPEREYPDWRPDMPRATD